MKLWDVLARGEPLVLPGASMSHHSLAFSRDSRLLAVGSGDRLLHVWNVASGNEQWKLVGKADEVRTVAFSPNGKLLASGGTGGAFNLWDVAAGREAGSFTGPGGDVVALGFISDETLAVGSADGVVRLRVVASRELLSFVLRPDKSAGELTSLAVQPGGEQLATAHADSTVRLWDLRSRKLERSFPLSDARMQVFHLAFTPEGRYLAVALADDTSLLLRLSDAK